MVIMFQSRWVKGRFCRDCGTAMGRQVLNRTLLAGWWGLISFFFNWYAIAVDVTMLRKVRSQRAPEGEAATPPLPAGNPLWKRGGIYVTAALLVAIVAFAGQSTDDGADAFAGKCVTFDAALTKVRTVSNCSDSHDGKVVGVVADRNDCPIESDGSLRLKADDDKVICVDVDQ